MLLNNKCSKNFDEKPHHRRGIFRWENSVDFFCVQPVGTLVDSMQENPDVIPSKVPLPVGIWIAIYYIVPWACASPHPKWHLDWFSRFCRAQGRYRQTDRQTMLLRL